METEDECALEEGVGALCPCPYPVLCPVPIVFNWSAAEFLKHSVPYYLVRALTTLPIGCQIKK